MGTRFELLLHGAGGSRLRAAGEEACRAIAEVERRASRFRGDSLVSLLNRSAGRAVRADDEFLDVLEACAAVHSASGGAFDPTVGALLDALGFHEPSPGEPLPEAVGFQRLEIRREERTVRLPAGMRLDLGAIGKGWALDLAASVLREAGVECALLHGGTSSVMALGAPPGAAAWRIGVRDPRQPGATAAVVELRDAALGVSAPHGRTVRRDGAVLGHVLDPRTGAPARGTLLAAAVAPTAALADAWSTALLVLGAVPARAPLTWTLLIPEDDREPVAPRA